MQVPHRAYIYVHLCDPVWLRSIIGVVVDGNRGNALYLWNVMQIACADQGA